jgi:poly [ADP-ribose] polymerase 7/11/12/13
MGYTSGKHKKKMLMCRVALGEVGQGKHGLRRPPSKPGKKGDLYDSVSNGSNVFVIFDNHQSYPEYIVTFSTSR